MAWYREGLNRQIGNMLRSAANDWDGDLCQALVALGIEPHAGAFGTPQAPAIWGTGGLDGDQLCDGTTRRDRLVEWKPPGCEPVNAVFRYACFMEPVKFRVCELDAACNEDQLTAVVTQTVGDPLRRFLARIAHAVGMGTLDAEDQARMEWCSLPGILHTLTRGTTYGCIDRSAYPQFNPGRLISDQIDPEHYVWWGPHALRRGAWLFETHPKYNFVFTGLVSKWTTEEGGEMYEWGQFIAKARLVCTAPWLNLRKHAERKAGA